MKFVPIQFYISFFLLCTIVLYLKKIKALIVQNCISLFSYLSLRQYLMVRFQAISGKVDSCWGYIYFLPTGDHLSNVTLISWIKYHKVYVGSICYIFSLEPQYPKFWFKFHKFHDGSICYVVSFVISKILIHI